MPISNRRNRVRVNPARTTHDYDGELVVFLIGMRVNRPWQVRAWWPVVQAMPAMLTELSKDPESGLLGFQMSLTRHGPLLVQYWGSTDKLCAYASRPDAEHRPAWTRFNRAVRRAPGAVGIWHETYVVERAETLYAGMPPFGLAAATAVVPVGPRSETAAARLAGSHVRPAA